MWRLFVPGCLLSASPRCVHHGQPPRLNHRRRAPRTYSEADRGKSNVCMSVSTAIRRGAACSMVLRPNPQHCRHCSSRMDEIICFLHTVSRRGLVLSMTMQHIEQARRVLCHPGITMIALTCGHAFVTRRVETVGCDLPRGRQWHAVDGKDRTEFIKPRHGFNRVRSAG